MLINQIINVDEEFESGDITEPVTLQQVKNYLRLEGDLVDSEGIIPQEPIDIILLEGETTITAPVNIAVLALTREGTGYSISDTLGNRRFTHNRQTGVIEFLNAGAAGGETINILFGTVSANASEDGFHFDDTLIESMITEARMWVEKFTGQYIIPRTLTVVLLNQAGNIELPGPRVGDIVLSDSDDIDSGDYDFIGTKFPKLETCFNCKVTATYEVGYSTFPAWVQNAILAYIADHYEYRGDDAPPAANVRAAQIARPYRRKLAWG